MPVMGFDDERGRDAWQAEMDARRAAGPSWEELLREVLQEIELREVERGDALAAFEAWREAARKFVLAVREAFRPVFELMEEIARKAVDAMRGLVEEWERLTGEGRKQGRYAGPPVHHNCRCLPVERVDPVRAGRSRWWTRK